MRVLTIRPPVNRKQAGVTDLRQAARVRLAIRLNVSPYDVSDRHAQSEARHWIAEVMGEEVQTWQ